MLKALQISILMVVVILPAFRLIGIIPGTRIFFLTPAIFNRCSCCYQCKKREFSDVLRNLQSFAVNGPCNFFQSRQIRYHLGSSNPCWFSFLTFMAVVMAQAFSPRKQPLLTSVFGSDSFPSSILELEIIIMFMGQ